MHSQTLEGESQSARSRRSARTACSEHGRVPQGYISFGVSFAGDGPYARAFFPLYLYLALSSSLLSSFPHSLSFFPYGLADTDTYTYAETGICGYFDRTVEFSV